MRWEEIEKQAAAEWVIAEISRGKTHAQCAAILSASKEVTAAELQAWCRKYRPSRIETPQSGAIHGNERLAATETTADMQWLDDIMDEDDGRAEVLVKFLDFLVDDISEKFNREATVNRLVAAAHLIRRSRHAIEQKDVAKALGVTKQAISTHQRNIKEYVNERTGGRASFAGLDETRKAAHKRRNQ